MSGKEFFLDRYRQLGWELKEVKLRQAIRVNNTNAKGKNLIERLESLGVHLEKIPFLPSGYWVLDSKVSAGATAEYLLGLYSIQEAAAQIPVSSSANLKGKKVLDAAAAPGGKTVQLADLMENTGVIVALDVDKRRLLHLSNHLERCHVGNTVVYLLDARQASNLNVKFDRVLAGCSLLRQLCSRQRLVQKSNPQRCRTQRRVQREILAKTVDCLTDDGEIVYSTCSLEPEENELNMDWAIKHLNLAN